MPQAEEPPDYWLSIGTQRFAVEVTTLVTEYSQAGKTPASEIGIGASIARLCEAIEASAKEAGILRGLYVLCFEPPFDNFFPSKRAIADQAREFIAKTKDSPQTGFMPCRAPEGQQFLIQKTSAQTCGVGHAMGSSSGGWAGDVEIQVQSLLDQVIAEKAGKLEGVKEPKILLLLDEYFCADATVHERCCKNVKAAPSFRAIFLVTEAERVSRIYPSDGEPL